MPPPALATVADVHARPGVQLPSEQQALGAVFIDDASAITRNRVPDLSDRPSDTASEVIVTAVGLSDQRPRHLVVTTPTSATNEYDNLHADYGPDTPQNVLWGLVQPEGSTEPAESARHPVIIR
jgi:hypothetical protein